MLLLTRVEIAPFARLFLPCPFPSLLAAFLVLRVHSLWPIGVRWSILIHKRFAQRCQMGWIRHCEFRLRSRSEGLTD